MSVTQVKQAVGSWSVRLRGNIPQSTLNALSPFGHIAIVPGAVNVQEYQDNLLGASRYVGVYRTRTSNTEGIVLSGVGLESWLGDENGNGDVLETAVELTGANFSSTVTALLPPSGAITPGTFYSVPGAYTGRHQWVTSRKAIDYATSIFGAEWRVNNNGTLDAGLISDLFVTTPRAILVSRDDASDLRYKALPGSSTMTRDSANFTTRVVVLGEGEGDAIVTGSADAPVVPYKDLHGNEVVVTRLVSESFTGPDNAAPRADVILSQYSDSIPSVNLSTSRYDVKGDIAVGDYIWVYNPANGFEDTANEVIWNGEPINPVKLRVVELSWPIRTGWTVAFRTDDGVWIDLTPYVFFEGGETTLVVGDLPRSLTGGVSEPIGSRPSVDTTIPDNPEFIDFVPGAYQSDTTNTTKAAVAVSWTLPLNLDDSTIIDGDHYEIRYRISSVIGYRVRWGEMEVYRWGEVSTSRWGAPLAGTIVPTTEWNTVYVPWGVNETSIVELTPGIIYDFQIRAVDTSGKVSPYSAVTQVTTVGDLFAPSVPAAPTVAASMTAMKVTHRLGKASGGTFNLEQDLDHLEVHVGGSVSFYPDSSTMVGRLVANAGMINAGIPAIGSFDLSQTTTVYVKVRAVDRAGNKSGASGAGLVTATLIDNAHISDLSVSKVTAGTISANWILGAIIRTALTGARVEISANGIDVYNTSGEQTMDVDSFSGNVSITGTLQTSERNGQYVKVGVNPFNGNPSLLIRPPALFSEPNPRFAEITGYASEATTVFPSQQTLYITGPAFTGHTAGQVNISDFGNGGSSVFIANGSAQQQIGLTHNPATSQNEISLFSSGRIGLDSATLGFFGQTGTVRPTITGSKGGNAALTSLLTALASMGLIINSTT